VQTIAEYVESDPNYKVYFSIKAVGWLISKYAGKDFQKP